MALHYSISIMQTVIKHLMSIDTSVPIRRWTCRGWQLFIDATTAGLHRIYIAVIGFDILLEIVQIL